MRRRTCCGLLWLAVVAAGCALVGGGCPCGADPTQPLGEHDLSFAGSHVVDGQCVCRCGDAEPIAWPKDRPCDEYEGECEASDGRSCCD